MTIGIAIVQEELWGRNKGRRKMICPINSGNVEDALDMIEKHYMCDGYHEETKGKYTYFIVDTYDCSTYEEFQIWNNEIEAILRHIRTPYKKKVEKILRLYSPYTIEEWLRDWLKEKSF